MHLSGIDENNDLKVFDKLDAQAVKAILAAEEEARRAGRKQLGSEQLLLGLMAPGNTGVASRVLSAIGLKAVAVRSRLLEIEEPGKGFVGVEVPFTERMNRVLEHAWKATQAQGRESISTEHLLLGLAEVFEGTAAQIFTESGITAEQIKSETLKTKPETTSEPPLDLSLDLNNLNFEPD